MTDQELERRLRAWYLAEIHSDEAAPAELRVGLAAIPRTRRSSAPSLGTRRNLTLLVAAAVTTALIAGAIAIGTGERHKSSGITTASSAPEPSVSAHLPNSTRQTFSVPVQTFGVPVRYTLPTGWEVRGDSPSLLQFISTGAASPVVVTLMPGATRVASSDCASGQSGATKLDQIVAMLRANPAFVVSNLTQITIDGRRAVGMTVSLAPDWTHTCLNSQGKPAAPFLADPIGLFNELDAGVAVRLILVDIGRADRSPAGGWSTTLVIAVAATPETLNAAVAQSQPIIESIRFGP